MIENYFPYRDNPVVWILPPNSLGTVPIRDNFNGSISATVTVDAIFAQYTFEHTFMEW